MHSCLKKKAKRWLNKKKKKLLDISRIMAEKSRQKRVIAKRHYC
jgi:hypothetical protein